MGLTESAPRGNYLNIVQGKLRMPTSEDNPKAVKREWEAKDGTKGIKHELVYDEISGVITSIKFKQSDFGEQLSIGIKDDKDYIINMPSDSRYAINFMRRLPAVDLGQKVELKPYDVTDDDGKRNTGIKITQGEVIKDQFYDAEKKKNVGGMPEMKVENPDADDWKVYFIGVKKFLKENTIKMVDNFNLENRTNHSVDVQDPIGEDEKDDLPF